jgi:regulator-associated protein of mTOR
MRTANQLPLVSGHIHPNPLASHAPAPVDMNGADHPEAAASSRPNTAAAAAAAPDASSASHMDEHAPPARPASIGPQPTRPSMLRAKSDFGPRHPALPPESTDEGSVDGHFKIRHGWDDQLNSEEYSNLLTSVRTLSHAPPATHS